MPTSLLTTASDAIAQPRVSTALTPYVLNVETSEPFRFDGVGAEIILDTIAAVADRFYAVTRLGSENYGQAGYCPCSDGHDGLPDSWIEYTEPGNLVPKTIRVHYCNGGS